MIHGFQNNGVKMSKSLGNVVAPLDFLAQYGLDQVRYFFLREVPFGAGRQLQPRGHRGPDELGLANNFGNLAQRSLSMVAKNCGGPGRRPHTQLRAGRGWPVFLEYEGPPLDQLPAAESFQIPSSNAPRSVPAGEGSVFLCRTRLQIRLKWSL